MGEGGAETAAPIVAISILHALSLIFTAIVVPKADTPRTQTFMRIFLYGGMIASGVLGTLQEATDVAYSPLNRALRASLHAASAVFFTVGLLLNVLQSSWSVSARAVGIGWVSPDRERLHGSRIKKGIFKKLRRERQTVRETLPRTTAAECAVTQYRPAYIYIYAMCVSSR